jgi:type I restriction enzyme S subunit
MWDDIAVPAWVTGDLDGVLCGYHLALIRSNPSQLLGEFLFRAFSAPLLARQFHVAADGVTRYGIAKHAIKHCVVLIPPLQEQDTLCRWIANRLQSITSSVERAQKEIDLIRENRTRLIADIVTGTLDVRGVELPEMDETSLLDEFDESEDVADLAAETGEVQALEEEDGD